MLKHALCALAFVGIFSSAAMADTISIRADIWCPYNCEPGSKKPGFGIEIAKAIFEKAGHTVDYQVLTWTRAIAETRADSHTAIIGANEKEVPDFVYPKEGIGYYQTAYASLNERPFEYGGPASLEDRLLGVIQSYSYDDELDAYIKANKSNAARIDMTAGDDALVKNLSKLMAGRVDVVADGAYVLLFKANEMQISDKIHMSRANRQELVYIAFSPKNPKSKDYAALYDKGLAELRASGELNKILARYGLKDWKE